MDGFVLSTRVFEKDGLFLRGFLSPFLYEENYFFGHCFFSGIFISEYPFFHEYFYVSPLCVYRRTSSHLVHVFVFRRLLPSTDGVWPLVHCSNPALTTQVISVAHHEG